MAKDYIPTNDEAFLDWFQNFATKLPSYTGTLGIGASTINSVNADLAMCQWINTNLTTYRTEAQERVQYRNLIFRGPIGQAGGVIPSDPVSSAPPAAVQPGVFPRIRGIVQRIKTHQNYTTAIGEDLGIVAPLSPVQPQAAKPKGKVLSQANSSVRITFTKGKYQGVLLESRRNDEASWSNLGIFISSPIMDSRPPLQANMAEVRYYRMRYVRTGNEPVGDWSDILQVTTIP